MADRRPGLADPANAAFAWARFRRIMRWMTLAAALCVVVALVGLDHAFGPLSIMAVVATVFGVGGSMLLAAALMGLIFLSSGSGHDETIDDLEQTPKDRPRM
ncbi:hypothetical protein EAH79_07830 [Sphingomonas koreensis]|nr:hypothetical protein EAH79_07830 [Sphingomonas koreensis]